MGNVGSGRRQRQDQIHRHNHHHALPAPPPPPNGRYPAYMFAANAPYHVQQPPPYGPPPPDPYHHPTYQSMPPIAPPLPPPPQLYHHQVYGQQGQPGPWAYAVRPPPPQGWSNGSQLSSSQQQQQQQPPQPPPPYVEHHKTTTIRNDVNLKKETLHLEKDEQHPDQYLVSFSFDSMVSGSISIFFFAKEGGNCGLTALKPDICPPLKIPFEKGLGQKFCQPSGTGIDLSFFEEVELTKVEADEVYPLVIRAEACSSQMPPIEPSETDQIGNPLPKSINSQITQAVFEKKDNGEYRVKVIKQILWVDGVRYELQEIYGIGTSAGSDFDANDPGKECVICMSEPRDTTVLPCRHMCMCSECAKLLRLQTNRCPICRRPVERLMEIKVNKNEEPENELP